MGSLDYIEISEDEAIELALGNVKGVVEVVEEEELDHENESDYEEVNEIMEGENSNVFTKEEEMTTSAQLQQAGTSIDEDQVEEMSRSGVDFSNIVC